MKVIISEFALERNVDRGAVNAWIRKHPNVNAACTKEGKEKVIDTSCPEYAELDKQYPLPQMVEVIEDKESRQKLIRAQELIIQLQAQLTEMTQQAALAQTNHLLLEDKQEQLEKAEKALETREKELSEQRLANDEMRDKLTEAEKRIQSLENRSFWQRLVNKREP